MKTASALLDRQEVVRTLTLSEALEKLEIEPFSKAAVAAYKQEVIESWWRKVSPYAYYFGKNPKAWKQFQILKPLLTIICWGVGVAFGTLAVLNETNYLDTDRAGVLGAWTLFCLFCLMIIRLEMREVSQTLQYWAFDSKWISEPCLLAPTDAPAFVKTLFERIEAQYPKATFFVHRFQTDPLIEVCAHSINSEVQEGYFIYGWYSNYELIEIDGKLIDMPMAKLQCSL